MDTARYTYKGKSWRPCSTTLDCNNFFHSAFGVRTEEGGAYFDKQAKLRRMRWGAFLTYFENETMPPRLADILRKCLSADDKYRLVPVDDKRNLAKYTSDIMVGDRSVSKEEIPILAALENVRVVVLSSREPDLAVDIKSNPDILGSYPIAPEKPREVVLCLKGNIFSRLELATEDCTPESHRTERGNKTAKEKPLLSSRYKKGGSAGSKGVQYQVGLLAIVLLNALKRPSGWRLSTENKDAGKFDDIVLEWPEGATFVQAKHKESKKKRITLEDLTSTNSKSDDFSLPKYFLSYLLIKEKFDVENVVICTNAGVHERALQFLNPQEAYPESILHYEEGDYSFHTLKSELLPVLEEKSRNYYRQNFKNNDIDECAINAENLRGFLQHLQLYFNYPPREGTEKITDKLLCSNSYAKISSSELCPKIMDWFQQKEGVYLTELHAKAVFSEIRRDRYCQKLEHYKLSFQKNDLSFQGQNQAFYVFAKARCLLQAIQIYHTVRKDKTKILFVNPDDDADTQKLAVEAFVLPQYVLLVIVSPKITERSVRVEIYGKLKSTLERNTYKKIILVADNDRLLQQIGLSNDTVRIDRSLTFRDLSPASQAQLLDKKNIIFQGRKARLGELLPARTIGGYEAAIDSEILEKLIREEDIKVGSPLSDLDELTRQYYINRTFNRKFNVQDEDLDSKAKETNFQNGGRCEKATEVYQDHMFTEISGDIWKDENRKEIFSEEEIFNVNEKLVLIADSAGAGKSTVLVKLASTIKENNPHLWVIRVVLNDFTSILGDLLDNGEETLHITRLLDSKSETKLSNNLEKCIFHSSEKVVLMLDGIDEISPDYTTLALSLIKRCLEAPNFIKIFVTTRPHLTEELEKVFKVKPFVLKPFTEQNQVDFLANYWVYTSELKGHTNKEKYKRYAKQVMNSISWTNFDNTESHFASIPLHVRMAAEVFQDTNRDEVEPYPTRKMNAANLYDLFFNKKWRIFCKIVNPERKTWANRELTKQFNVFRACHRNLALEVIVVKDILRYFSDYQPTDTYIENNLCKIGIVQRFNDKLDFIHRTFADYFFAECLLMELRQNPTAEFQMFLIDTIFLHPQYNVTRNFFDGFLEKVVDSLPFDTFEKYQFVNLESSPAFYLYQSKLIHTLAETGCVATLRLILKCIDFETVKGREINIEDFYASDFDEDVRKIIFGNTLNVLQHLTRRAGLNIVNERLMTPLHVAGQEGRLEMVKFLIEQGANIEAKSTFGYTALHLAVARGHLNIVKFFVDYGQDFEATTDHGRTLLHVASSHGHLDIVEYLLQLGVDSEIMDSDGFTALAAAVRYGQLDTVKFLVEYGMDIKVTNDYRRTLLHLASGNGRLDTVKYLLELDIDFGSRDNDGCSALHLAACFGRLDVVKFLVERGLDFEVTNNFGRTLMHLASGNGHLDVVKFLREIGVDCNVKDHRGITAFQMAVYFGQSETVEFLLEFDPDFSVTDDLVTSNGDLGTVEDAYDGSVLEMAICRGHLDVVKNLVEYGVDFRVKNGDGSTLLHSASASGQLEMVKYLLDLGIDRTVKDGDGFAVVHTASYYSQIEIVKFFAERGLGFNEQANNGCTPLHLACVDGDLDLVKFLIELGSDFNIEDNKGFRAVQTAAYYNHLDIVKFLVQSGADYNVTDGEGSTLLHLVIEKCHLDIVRYVFELGVDCNLKDNDGFTPLQIATYFGRLDVVEYLLQRGLNVNIRFDDGRTLLHLASSNGYLNIVKFLIERGVDSNTRDTDGFVALHFAVCFGHLDIAKFFVELGVDFNVTNNFDQTPLHLASSNGHLHLVKFLVKLGADFTVRDNDGFTALQTAAFFGQLDIVKFFAGYGLEFNVTCRHGRTLLHTAIWNGHLETVKYLLELDGVDLDIKDNDGYAPLHTAVHLGQSHILEFLVQHGVDINVACGHGITLLHSASMNGHLHVVKFLIEFDVDFDIRDDDGRTALHLAAQFGQLDIVKLLVGLGLDCNATSSSCRTPVHSASENGRVETVKFLLESGADFSMRDDRGFTALHTAACFGHLDVVEFLAENGLDVSVTSSDGRTPLHSASEYGHSETVKFLTELDVDLNVKDYDGFTALHLAAQYGHLDTVELLLKRGLDFNDTSSYGYTPLHLASENGHLDTVTLLLEYDVDFQIRDGDGFTALQAAVYFNRLDAAQFLVEHGLDFNVMCNYGRTLLHLACRNGHLDPVKFLLELGVDPNIRDSSGSTALHLAVRFGHSRVVKSLLDMVRIYALQTVEAVRRYD